MWNWRGVGLTRIHNTFINADSRFKSRGVLVTFNPLLAYTQPLSLGRHPHAIVPAFYTAAASARRNEEEDQPAAAAPPCQTDQDGGGDGGGDTRLMFARKGEDRPPIQPPARPRPCPPNPKQLAIVGSPNFLRVAVRSQVDRTRETRPIEVVIERIHLRSVDSTTRRISKIALAP